MTHSAAFPVNSTFVTKVCAAVAAAIACGIAIGGFGALTAGTTWDTSSRVSAMGTAWDSAPAGTAHTTGTTWDSAPTGTTWDSPPAGTNGTARH
ncbi:hypothetical protein AB0O34_29520 [Sphaerisporangium sp. NPDC088356]|uniref:hypothetical protein n=1 Tax=Sphaerisporangium sp. NPDC088356 TaxID=3154871 RepID=UPI003414DE7B